MGQSVGGGSQDHTFGETGPPSANDQQVGTVHLTDVQEPAPRVTQLLDRLVVDTIEIEMILELLQDLLLTLDESC
jgi:hypothetical protein